MSAIDFARAMLQRDTMRADSVAFADGTLWTANNFPGFTRAIDRPA